MSPKDTTYRVRRSVLVIGERGGENVSVVDTFFSFLFRIKHTPESRTYFERQCDRRGVNWTRVRDDSGSVYEVTGRVDLIERLSREKVVRFHGSPVEGEPDREREDGVTLSRNVGVPGYQSPCPFSPRRG